MAKASGSDGDPECQRDQQEIVLSYACRNVTMSSLAERLPMVARAYFDKPVVDRTGLKGAYDFRLEWVGRTRAQAGQTIYASLEKQLGLTVETQRGADGVAVDRAGEPDADTERSQHHGDPWGGAVGIRRRHHSTEPFRRGAGHQSGEWRR